MQVFLVGRLETDPVVDGLSCRLALATGRVRGVREEVEQRDIQVVGGAAGQCRGLRSGAVVAVEGTVSAGGRMVATRVIRR